MCRASLLPAALLAALLMAAPRVQACEPATVNTVQMQVQTAERAYANLDTAGFVAATTQITTSVGCLAEPLTPALAASVHRMVGLRAFADRDVTRSKQAFAAARAIEPDYRFPVTLVPARHPLWAEYDAIPLEGALTVTVPAPATGALLLDGRVTLVRPASRPVLLQLTDPVGRVVSTTYLWPTDPVPDYPVANAPLVVSEPVEPAGPRRRPLLVAAGGSLLVAGALYGGAAISHGQWEDRATPYEDTPDLRSQTNALVYASGAAMVVSVGFGLGAVIVGRW